MAKVSLPLEIDIYCRNNDCIAQKIAANPGTLANGCFVLKNDCELQSTTAEVTSIESLEKSIEPSFFDSVWISISGFFSSVGLFFAPIK